MSEAPNPFPVDVLFVINKILIPIKVKCYGKQNAKHGPPRFPSPVIQSNRNLGPAVK